jgi:hypothetical protein
MEGIFSSSNKNQSKTLEELVGGKKIEEAIAAYAFYLSTKGHALEGILKDAPQAFPSLSELIENLETFGECKSFLTNDQETLQKCIDEYNFREGVLGGIWEYTIWKHTPEQIKEFTKGLEALAKGGKKVIKDLYNRYQQYKTTPIPQEDIDPRVLEIIPEIRAIESLILRYSENPEGYGKQLSKYLGKKLLEAKVEEREEVKADKELRKATEKYTNYLSVLKDAFSKIPSFILQYLKSYRKAEIGEKEGHRKAEIGEVEIREELKEAIGNYTLYASYMIDALHIVSEHIPEALPSLATLIKNLEEWNGYKSLLTIDQEALKEYADKYYFMAYFMGSILEWWVSKWRIPPEEIEGFIEGMRTLAKGGKEIIDGLYRHYREVERTELENILKDKNYQTIPPFKLEEARASAAGTIEYLLVNYFRNPREHEDQLMKYVGKKH